jgi:hypothetical protein
VPKNKGLIMNELQNKIEEIFPVSGIVRRNMEISRLAA